MRVTVYPHKAKDSHGVLDALHKAGISYKTGDLIIPGLEDRPDSFSGLKDRLSRPLIVVEGKDSTTAFFGYFDPDKDVIPTIKAMMAEESARACCENRAADKKEPK